jgi:hypothetical protein
VQLYRYFVGQFSEFCRHNPLCFFQRVFIVVVHFVIDSVRELLDTLSYYLELSRRLICQIPDDDDRDGPRNVGFIQTPNAADSRRRLHRRLGTSFLQNLINKITAISASENQCSVSQTYGWFAEAASYGMHTASRISSCWCSVGELVVAICWSTICSGALSSSVCFWVCIPSKLINNWRISCKNDAVPLVKT